MKLVTSCECPPIPWRKFDWVAFDEDQMSGVCGDPDCHCRENLIRGWGETEEAAIHAFVHDLLERYGFTSIYGGTSICELQPLREKENCDERENEEAAEVEERTAQGATTEETEYLNGEGPTETFVGHCPGCAASR